MAELWQTPVKIAVATSARGDIKGCRDLQLFRLLVTLMCSVYIGYMYSAQNEDQRDNFNSNPGIMNTYVARKAFYCACAQGESTDLPGALAAFDWFYVPAVLCLSLLSSWASTSVSCDDRA